MNKRFINTLIALTLLTFISLACSLGGPQAAGTPYPTLEPTALAYSLATSIAITPETRTAVITVDEQQVTSYLSQKIDEQPDAPFANPQVILQDGKVEIYGTAGVSLVTANVKVVVGVSLDSQGAPIVSIESANFGPIPVPASLSDFLMGMIERAIQDGFGSNPQQLRILDLSIMDGLMVVTLQQNS